MSTVLLPAGFHLRSMDFRSDPPHFPDLASDLLADRSREVALCICKRFWLKRDVIFDIFFVSYLKNLSTMPTIDNVRIIDKMAVTTMATVGEILFIFIS